MQKRKAAYLKQCIQKERAVWDHETALKSSRFLYFQNLVFPYVCVCAFRCLRLLPKTREFELFLELQWNFSCKILILGKERNDCKNWDGNAVKSWDFSASSAKSFHIYQEEMSLRAAYDVLCHHPFSRNKRCPEKLDLHTGNVRDPQRLSEDRGAFKD